MAFVTSINRNAEYLDTIREEIKQNKAYLEMDRMKVSQTIKDLVEHCEANYQSDLLLNPVRDNPFRPKKSFCQIL